MENKFISNTRNNLRFVTDPKKEQMAEHRKKYESGRKWFIYNGKLEEASLNLQNDSSFLKGFKDAALEQERRYSKLFNLGFKWGKSGTPEEKIPEYCLQDKLFMDGYDRGCRIKKSIDESRNVGVSFFDNGYKLENIPDVYHSNEYIVSGFKFASSVPNKDARRLYSLGENWARSVFSLDDVSDAEKNNEYFQMGFDAEHKLFTQNEEWRQAGIKSITDGIKLDEKDWRFNEPWFIIGQEEAKSNSKSK